MVKFFKTPFASNGDKLNIPDELQEDGSISFDQGYGEDYEKNRKTDPDAKNISRQSFNGLLHDITDAIGDIQRSGVAKWSDEVTYNKGSLVWHNKSLYSSLLDSNKSQPPSASWTTLLTEESLDLSKYRKKDDNIFNGYLQVRSENEDQGTGVSLQDTDGTLRGQVVATDQGLQLTQYLKDGGSQTFTFPSEGGELHTKGGLDYVNDLVAEISKGYIFNSFYTGDHTVPDQPPIFGGSKNAFQSFCIYGDRLFVTQSAYGDATNHGNFLKGESYRIVEYRVTGEGEEIHPVAFSEVLDIGHASGLSYTVNGGVLYLYSGYPNPSETDPKKSGKGFSKIRWRGSDTSQDDVELIRLLGDSKGEFGYELSHSNVYATEDFIVLLSDNNNLGFFECLVYDINSATNVSSRPIYRFPLSIDGMLQGTVLYRNLLYIYSQNTPTTTSLGVYNLKGDLIGSINDINLLQFSKSPSFKGSVNILEAEGLWIDESGVYLGFRETVDQNSDIVSFMGRLYISRKSSKGISPRYGNFWQPFEDDLNTYEEYDYNKDYHTEAYRVYNGKHIIKLSKFNGKDLTSNLVNPANTYNTDDSSIDLAMYSPNTGEVYPILRYNKYTGSYSFHDSHQGKKEPIGYLRARNRFGEVPHISLEVGSGKFSVKEGGVELEGRDVQDGGNGVLNISQGTGVVRSTKLDQVPVYAERMTTAVYYLTSLNGRHLSLQSSSDDSYRSHVTRIFIDGKVNAFRPASKDSTDLGLSSHTFKDLYLLNAPTITSDIRAKYDVTDIDNKYFKVMENINFKMFKLRSGTSGRKHFGVIAQDWINACDLVGVDPHESGILVGDEKTGYSIRYTEFMVLRQAYLEWKLLILIG